MIASVSHQGETPLGLTHVVANSIDESTFNQIASKREGQSKTLRLLDELAAHYQTLWGLGEHP